MKNKLDYVLRDEKGSVLGRLISDIYYFEGDIILFGDNKFEVLDIFSDDVALKHAVESQDNFNINDYFKGHESLIVREMIK